MVTAVLFAIGSQGRIPTNQQPTIRRCEIDMQGLDDKLENISPEDALMIVRMTKKKVNISGKWYLFWWKNRLFCFLPQGGIKGKETIQVFELPLEFTQGKISES